MSEQIAIIGAGIGGLTLALYLKKNGYQPLVYESAASLEPVGAGIMMAYNAMQVFEDLGIANQIEAAGNRIEGVVLADKLGKTITSSELSKSNIDKGIYNVAIHRADLQKILSETLGFDCIKLNKRLQSVKQTADNISLYFEDGTSADCNILFGADGLNSKLRSYVVKASVIRDAGQLCWRGICDNNFSDIKNNIGIEYWAYGDRFGYTVINQKQIYWYAVCNANRSDSTSIPESLKAFNPTVQKIIAATAQENIHFSTIADLKPIERWHINNICLIGDAAHATTPNMGQGACQAIEDAYTIGKLLENGHKLPELFGLYQSIRSQKVNSIVRQSLLLGRISHIENKFFARLRNFAMRNAPASAAQRQLDFITNIDYIKKACTVIKTQ